VRPFADDRDRRVVTGLVHRTLLTILAAAIGIVAAILLGTDGGPQMAPGLSLYNYCLQPADRRWRADTPRPHLDAEQHQTILRQYTPFDAVDGLKIAGRGSTASHSGGTGR
jgi:hypothetical protein